MDIHTGPLLPLSPADSLEQQLSCPICLDMFSRPVVILPCQHNLCRGCANDLYESRNPYRMSGGTFRCPSCRFEVVLDRHGVFGLQRNLLVENIIDIYKQQQEKRGGSDAPLKDKDTKEPTCTEHEGERINIYCVTCQTPTCSMCKVFGAHKDCNVSPLSDAYQKQQAELRGAVERLTAGNSRVQAAVTQMDHTCTQIQENAELQRRRLGESFDLLFAILEERKLQLLERVDVSEERKQTALRGFAERYKLQLESGNQLHEKMTQALQRCGAAEFLLSAKQLQQEAEEVARAARLQGPDPGLQSMDHLTVDTKEAEALLARMDFRLEGDQDQEGDQDAARD